MTRKTDSAAKATDSVLREHAEHQFQHELEALARVDDRPRPPSWRLSPWAVSTYLLGGTAGKSAYFANPMIASAVSITT